MKLLLAGGTGVLGRAVVPRLVDQGHDVLAVSRRTEADDWLAGVGARAVRLDIFDADAVTSAAEGSDAVVNLATAIPSSPLPPRRWATNDRLRRDASAAFATAALQTGARFIQESFAPTYADRGDAWITETTPLDPVDQTRTVVDAEASVARVTAAGGTGVVLRFGLFYDGTGAGEQVLGLARRGRYPLPGAGDAHATMVHTEDAATAVVAALTVPAGTYNAVEDEPMTRAAHAEVLAGLLGLDRVKPLPGLVGRVPYLRTLSRSQRISNAALRAASGWAPRFPSVREGWSEALGQVADAG